MLRLIALILPLALDTFAVSAAIGLGGLTRRQRLRISVVFTLFEAGTPIVGVLLGAPLGHAIGGTADLVAVAILIGYGLVTVFRRDEDAAEGAGLGSARGLALLLLGLSVSLDELAIGFTLGLLRVAVLPVLLAIAGQTFLVTQLGLRLGSRVPVRLRVSAGRLAGAVLVTLGVVLLVRHLT